MRKEFISFILSLFILNAHAQQVPAADNVLKAAVQQASKEKKNIIVIFHASWCVWCRRMDTSLNDPSVKKIFDKNYVITHLTVQESAEKKHLENSGAEKFMNEMGGKDQGLPYWIVLDTKGNKLSDSKMDSGENTGCPASEKEVAHFIQVLKNTSSLKNDALELIARRFRNNE